MCVSFSYLSASHSGSFSWSTGRTLDVSSLLSPILMVCLWGLPCRLQRRTAFPKDGKYEPWVGLRSPRGGCFSVFNVNPGRTHLSFRDNKCLISESEKRGHLSSNIDKHFFGFSVATTKVTLKLVLNQCCVHVWSPFDFVKSRGFFGSTFYLSVRTLTGHENYIRK